MRASLSQQIQNALVYMESTTTRLSDAQRVAVTGKRINKASDDVPGTNNAMSLRSSINSIEQYANNITVGKPLLSATMNAANEMGNIIKDVRDIAVAAANPDYTGQTRQTYINELDNLMSQLVDIAKTKHNDQYVFSGTATDASPIIENPNKDPETGLPPYVYQGTTNQRYVKILSWVSLPVNVAGNDIFGFDSTSDGGDGDVFSMITRVKNAIQSGDTDKVSSEIENVDKVYDNVLTWHARLGSWSARMDNASSTLDDTKVRLKEMLSDTEDVDLTEAIVNLKTQENIYQTAISVTQRILQMSLASQSS